MKFEVENVSAASLRIVSRDRKCQDKNKSGCNFDKEVLGVTEMIPLNSPENGYIEDTYKMDSYFQFDKNDRVRSTHALNLNAKIKIDQFGYVVRCNKAAMCAWPYTKKFRNHSVGWRMLDGKINPTNGAPKILKQVCVVNLKDGVELNLAVSCESENGGSVRLVPMSSLKQPKMEPYVGLFETRTSRKNGKINKGYDASKCYVRTEKKISDTCMEIHLVWDGKQYSRLRSDFRWFSCRCVRKTGCRAFDGYKDRFV